MPARHTKNPTAKECQGKSDGTRRCLLTGESLPKDELIRFVVSPEGVLVADIDERLPGRGLWLSADIDMIGRARATHSFARAARCSVTIPDDLEDQVAGQLRRKCLQLIGMARRAGQIAAGFQQVSERLGQHKDRPRDGILLAASDGAEDGRAKLRRLAEGMLVVERFSAEELGHALGRDHVVHAVIDGGGLAERLARELKRLAGVARPRQGPGQSEPAAA